MKSSNEKYLKEKLRQIEEEVAVLSGVAAMVCLMEGRATNQVINARDRCYLSIEKKVHQIIKRIIN